MVYNVFVSGLQQIGSTPSHRPMVGSALCMAASARSIRVRCSKKTRPGYNQTEDGRFHTPTVAGAIPAPGTKPPAFIDAFGIPTNARTGKVAFQTTRPDQFSL